MSAVHEKMVSLFDELEIRYSHDQDEQCVRVDFRSTVGLTRVAVWVDADNDLLHVLAFSPVRVPEGSRPAVAEALARINFGAGIGKLEMNYEDGELRFHVSHILVGDWIDRPLLERVMYGSLDFLDRFVPAILSIVYGNENPVDAVRHAHEAILAN